MSAPTPQSFVQAAIAAEREQWGVQESSEVVSIVDESFLDGFATAIEGFAYKLSATDACGYEEALAFMHQVHSTASMLRMLDRAAKGVS